MLNRPEWEKGLIIATIIAGVICLSQIPPLKGVVFDSMDIPYPTVPPSLRDQRFNRASMRALSNPISTSPSTTRAGAERTPMLNSSSRASSSIIRSFLKNETPLPVRYSASAEQGPQKGCEYIVILWSLIRHSLFSLLMGHLLECLKFEVPKIKELRVIL